MATRRRARRWAARGIGIAAAHLLDRAIGDPHRLHPVAGLGKMIAAGEERLNSAAARPGASRARGALLVAVTVGGCAGAGYLLDRAASRCAPIPAAFAEAATVAATTWVALGGTTLLRAAGAVGDALSAADLDQARHLLPWLCGRDPALLDAEEIARAVVESLAENTSDAHVAPVWWAMLGGSAGALGYRAVNTLDAMLGYRSPRFLHFGWAAARLDDLANWPPARLAGMLTCAAAPQVGGSPRRARAVWSADAAGHPSPNAGVVEASAAGALGVQLGGRTPYAHGVEMRPVLGAAGRPVEVADIERAARLEAQVQTSAVACAVAILAVCALVAGER